MELKVRAQFRQERLWCMKMNCITTIQMVRRLPLAIDRKSTRLNSSHHRDLHSFPTRRSSDLHGIESTCTVPAGAFMVYENELHYHNSNGTPFTACDRSEEHTSELQSPPRSTLFPYTTLFRSTWN